MRVNKKEKELVEVNQGGYKMIRSKESREEVEGKEIDNKGIKRKEKK